MSSSSWSFVTNDNTGLRTYSRRLGDEELGFYWDAVFHGTATTNQNFEVKLSPPEDYALLSEENVVRTWLRIKNIFPLVGCRVVEGDDVVFCLDEETLSTIPTHELQFRESETGEDFHTFSNYLLNGPPIDCSKSVSRVLILRRRDRPASMQVVFSVAHCVTDVMSNASLIQAFCDELCKPSVDPKEGLAPLEDRLSKVLSLDAYRPWKHISPVRMKWRRAAAKTILQLRQQKLVGGHTLPSRFSPQLMFTPAFSRELYFAFPEDQTAAILAGCRARKMTLGNALHVISQVAHARLLHRFRLQHAENPSLEFGITPEEWESRIRQPMFFGGPLNMRPLLDPTWYKNGGATELCLSIGFWYISLPSMPFSKRPVETWAKEFPSFDELMSRERFKLRVDFVGRKMAQIIKNPLYHEISEAMGPSRVERKRGVAVSWRERLEDPSKKTRIPSDPLPPVIFANGGSSIGNGDNLLANEYPLKNPKETTTAAPKFRIGEHTRHLRCRPGELYLGAITYKKKLEYFLLYDANVFDEKIVRMWIKEVTAATLHFLTVDGEQDGGAVRSKL